MLRLLPWSLPRRSAWRLPHACSSPLCRALTTKVDGEVAKTGNVLEERSFLDEAEQHVASVFLGKENATAEDLKKLTAHSIEKETRYWLPDPTPRWTGRDFLQFMKEVRSMNNDGNKANAQNILDTRGRPHLAAFFMGPTSAVFYEALYKLESLQTQIQTEEIPDSAPDVVASPWKSRGDMSVLLQATLKSNQYRRLLNVLNEILSDSRCIYVMDELRPFMRPSAMETQMVVEHKPDKAGRMYATGRRKTSVARVWVSPGTGKMVVNGMTVPDYFDRLIDRQALLEPFVVTNTAGQYDVYATVKGGGTTGQSNALRHGISVALQRLTPELRPPLRMERLFGNQKISLLTRDARKVERKKPGQKKARKKFAWVKR